MAGKLDGKVAIVTGASSGIGEATAIALAQEGAKVAISARRKDRLDALAKRIADMGGEAFVIEADVADAEQAQNMVKQSHAHFGRTDILVNNAGVMLLGPVDGIDINEWKRMLDTNVWGLMVATHAALPCMKQNGGGHVVMVSSVAGRGVSPVSSVYAATKHAVGAFGEGLRKQESKNNIRMTLIEPGAVVTELLEHMGHQDTKQMMQEWVGGMKRPLQSEDIAASIVYAVTQPPHVNVNEIMIRPIEQDG